MVLITSKWFVLMVCLDACFGVLPAKTLVLANEKASLAAAKGIGVVDKIEGVEKNNNNNNNNNNKQLNFKELVKIPIPNKFYRE